MKFSIHPILYLTLFSFLIVLQSCKKDDPEVINEEEEIDNDKFLAAYCEKAIKGWKGLKVKHLPLLLPVDISGDNGEEEILYSQEEALSLITNSTVFDQFVTDTMNEFEQFSITKKETDVKNLKSSSGTSSKQGE